MQDEFPDGRAVMLGARFGVLRARYRHGYGREELDAYGVRSQAHAARAWADTRTVVDVLNFDPQEQALFDLVATPPPDPERNDNPAVEAR